MRAVGPALALGLLPGSASAHLVGVEFGDFYAGSLHLLTAPPDLALLAALGALAGHQARERARWALLTLPLGLLAGVGVALADTAFATAEPAVALALALAGLLAAAALSLPAWAIAGLAGLAGVALGATNGIAARGESVDVWLYAAGVTTAGGVVGTLAIALGAVAAGWRPWTPLALRVLGSWFAAVGAMVFALGFAA